MTDDHEAHVRAHTEAAESEGFPLEDPDVTAHRRHWRDPEDDMRDMNDSNVAGCLLALAAVILALGLGVLAAWLGYDIPK